MFLNTAHKRIEKQKEEEEREYRINTASWRSVTGRVCVCVLPFHIWSWFWEIWPRSPGAAALLNGSAFCHLHSFLSLSLSLFLSSLFSTCSSLGRDSKQATGDGDGGFRALAGSKREAMREREREKENAQATRKSWTDPRLPDTSVSQRQSRRVKVAARSSSSSPLLLLLDSACQTQLGSSPYRFY